MECSDCA